MNVHYLQHAPQEGLGMMEDWFLERSHSLTSTCLFLEGSCLPKTSDFDFLVILGGSMGVYERERYPWLRDEEDFVLKCIQEKKVVLGICLGAQIIASALGSSVHPHVQKEIGWFPVHFTPEAPDWLSLGKKAVSTFHWHGDTFSLPVGSLLLASSEVTSHQGFLFGDKVLALQFHLETDGRALEAFLQSDGRELTGTGSCQTPAQARSGLVHVAQARPHLESILEHLESLIAS